MLAWISLFSLQTIYFFLEIIHLYLYLQEKLGSVKWFLWTSETPRIYFYCFTDRQVIDLIYGAVAVEAYFSCSIRDISEWFTEIYGTDFSLKMEGKNNEKVLKGKIPFSAGLNKSYSFKNNRVHQLKGIFT